MARAGFVFIICFSSLIWSSMGESLNTKEFPADFLLGVASASYQIEGAWNEDGKGENIWDNLTHAHPEWMDSPATGDVAADAYHHVEGDVAMIKDLGVDSYRFSMSWSRILPKGYSYYVNQAGIDYYNKLIDALVAANITPLVTLYHWDLPQVLQDLGGWPNEVIADYFQDYARVAFENFGDRVKHWITLNEPFNVCQQGYGDVLDAPALNMSGFADYLCTHTVLKAHAKVYHMYDEEFRPTQHGGVSIVLDSHWYEPYNASDPDDVDAAERLLQFQIGWYAHAIYGPGDYPEVIKTRVAERSAAEGYSESRLPEFTAEEIRYIKGTFDFFCLNHYSSIYATKVDYPIGETAFAYDVGARVFFDESWDHDEFGFLNLTPWGFRNLLNWVKNTYGDIEIYVTENGYVDSGQMNDTKRIIYLESYMSAVLDAIDDGVNVKAYTIWSLMDDFEWLAGYSGKLGLYSVDFNSANRTRSPKLSAGIIKEIIANRRLPSETYSEDSGANSLFSSILCLFIILMTSLFVR